MRPEKEPRKNTHENGRMSDVAVRVALAVLLAVTLTFSVHAEETPASSPQDARVRFVDYDENDVVRIIGHYGYSTHVSLAAGETVTSVALGDSLAWEVAPVENHLFVKPREEDARTNMTVLTSRGRAYTFFLETVNKRSGQKVVATDLFFRVTFRYPEDEKAKALKVDEEAVARKLLADTQRSIRNINYFACGSDDVNPDQAFDDGRFTFLRYAGSREMPAVFVVNSDGTEALVDTHVEADTIVVHRVAERFVFRRGGTVGCIVNKSFDPQGVETLSGTVDEDVVRIVKGGDREKDS